MKILLIAEPGSNAFKLESSKALCAALQIGSGVDVLIAGEQCGDAAAQAAAFDGVDRVLVAEAPWLAQGLAEELSALVLTLAGEYSHILMAATSAGKDVMPRVAAALNVAQCSEISQVIGEDTFVRPIYAGNAMAKVKLNDPVKLLTVRASAFDAAASGDNSAEITSVSVPEAVALSRFVNDEISQSDRPELGAARVVVSGGRGVGSSENFAVIERLADRLGGAVGASRAAVDAGYVPNELQVGQTGKVVAPDLYIALGISGAIQHLAGMKDSKVIVAINKDPDAPIFEVADYGLVGDLFEVIPELIERLPG